ncbi:hypothetical protein E3_1750 [Rhodococcus phage E3]|uniref:hypothetical protein n=1 Tax=Rhodococcus phage E3 TaxID=1007869 RepID=UPI0002C69CA5|nr:hypothetical protein M176_gp185 [Rhodococcus phage E3]AEQ21093.1 hypothetical protein E3_1750 [Rhodococcus phage E3]
MSENPILVEPDSRGRVSLSQVGRKSRYYRVTEEAGGIIVLRPAVILTVDEALEQGVDPDVVEELLGGRTVESPSADE